MMPKVNDIVRVIGEKKGSANEYARVVHVYDNQKMWISNLNQPFQGTISRIVEVDEVALLK